MGSEFQKRQLGNCTSFEKDQTLPLIKTNDAQRNIANLVNMVGTRGTKISSAEATACISLQKILKTLQPGQSEIQKLWTADMNITQ